MAVLKQSVRRGKVLRDLLSAREKAPGIRRFQPRGIMQSSFWAMLGAADALSHAAATAEITAQQAQDELFEIIVAMVSRTPGSAQRVDFQVTLETKSLLPSRLLRH
jgi:hypothetical protein